MMSSCIIFWVLKASIVPLLERHLLWVAEGVVPFYSVCKVALHIWLLKHGVEYLIRLGVNTIEQRLDIIIKYSSYVIFTSKGAIDGEIRRFVSVMKQTFYEEEEEEDGRYSSSNSRSPSPVSMPQS